MFKLFMSLITALGSFFGLWGINYAALATPIVNYESNSVVNHSPATVKINLSDSLWQINNQKGKAIFEHLGCNCAVCSTQEEISNSL